jgi:hypothetical protein
VFTDGLVWIEKPNAFTSGQKGSNIAMKWQWKTWKNEEFLSSTCYENEPYKRLASKHPGEDHYVPFNKETPPYISISGTDDVTLTIQNAKSGYNGEYCCKVTFKSNNENYQNKTCTHLFVYGMIFIGYYYMIDYW